MHLGMYQSNTGLSHGIYRGDVHSRNLVEMLQKHGLPVADRVRGIGFRLDFGVCQPHYERVPYPDEQIKMWQPVPEVGVLEFYDAERGRWVVADNAGHQAYFDAIRGGVKSLKSVP